MIFEAIAVAATLFASNAEQAAATLGCQAWAQDTGQLEVLYPGPYDVPFLVSTIDGRLALIEPILYSTDNGETALTCNGQWLE